MVGSSKPPQIQIYRPEIMPGGFSLPSQNATERPQSHKSRQRYKHTTDTQNTPQRAKTSHREPRPKTTERPTTSSHAALMGLCSFTFRIISGSSCPSPVSRVDFQLSKNAFCDFSENKNLLILFAVFLDMFGKFIGNN